MNNILSVEHVSISYIAGDVLHDVSLYVQPGDRIGVIGVNGAGKSTLLRIAAGDLAPMSGTVSVAHGARLAYLPQSPAFARGSTVLQAVFSGISHPTDEQEYEARAILDRMGVSDMNALVDNLSGGQRKRIAIAAALVRESDLLLLDEPTNHIDVEMIAWLEERLKARKGALMMVTHDRYFLERICNRIVEVDGGKLYEYEANYSKYLELKAEREQMADASRRKLESLYRNELKWIRRGAQARTTKQKFRVERFDDIKDALTPEKREKQVDMNLGHARLGRQLIDLDAVSKGFDGRTLFGPFSYSLTRDARIGILGANGCGKSTLLKLIAGELAPDSGSVVCGETVKIGYLKQEVPVYDKDVRVIDAVKEIATAIRTEDGVLTASQLCEQFMIDSTMQYTQASRLSGGEKRRLYLMQVLMGAPNVLLLDEPTNDIDIQTLTILESYLETFPGPVIAVSHDRYFLDKFANRVFAIAADGQILDSVGGYTDYREMAQALGVASKPDTAPKQSAATPRSAGKRKLRFTFKEQREFDTIDETMARQESELAALDSEMSACASDYVKLQALTEKREALEKTIAETTERWFYLTELNERIQRGEYED